jgi:hypothetical protein
MSVQFTDTNSPAQLQGKFFSPQQVFIGTIFGGTVSGMYFVAKNYESLGDIKKKNLTLIFGILSIITLMTILILTNYKLSSIGLSAGLGAGLSFFTRNLFQMNNIPLISKSLFASTDSKELKHSNWYVVGVIISGIILGVIGAFTIAFIFTALGVPTS